MNAKARVAYLKGIWALATKVERLPLEEQAEYYDKVGPVKKGMMIMHNTGHIHRGPGCTTVSPRYGIFVALASQYNLCEREVIYDYNWQERWEARHSKARDELMNKKKTIERKLAKGEPNVMALRHEWWEAEEEYEEAVKKIHDRLGLLRQDIS